MKYKVKASSERGFYVVVDKDGVVVFGPTAKENADAECKKLNAQKHSEFKPFGEQKPQRRLLS